MLSFSGIDLDKYNGYIKIQDLMYLNKIIDGYGQNKDQKQDISEKSIDPLATKNLAEL